MSSMFFEKIKNISATTEIFNNYTLSGVNFDASARYAFAGEVILLGLYKDDLAINRGMDSEVAAHKSARAGNLSSAGLANENFTSLHLLTAETLDAKSLAGIVV